MDAATRLKEHRIAAGRTLAQQAELFGISAPTLSRWETGERYPDEQRLPLISELTGISQRDLRPDLFERAEKLLGAAQ